MALAALIVRIGADLTDLNKALNQTDRDVQRFGRKMNRAGRSMSMGITAPLALVGAGMVKMASDAEEASSKMTAVFGANRKEMDVWIKGLQSSVPATTKQLHELTSGIQDLLVPLGMAPAAAMKMTQQITVLAADLASFNNIPIEEALAGIRSGLVGQYEPLLKFGVALNATRVKAEAVRLGLHKGKGELDANAKAQVAFRMILERTTAAHGDAARTANSAANQLKFLARDAKEVAIGFGQILLPAVVPLIRALKGLAGGVSEMSTSTKSAIAITAVLVGAVGPLLIVFGKLLTLLPLLKVGFLALATGPAGLVVTALTLITAEFIRQGNAAQKAKADFDAYVASLNKMPAMDLRAEQAREREKQKTLTSNIWTKSQPVKGEGFLGRRSREASVRRMRQELEKSQNRSRAIGSQLNGSGIAAVTESPIVPPVVSDPDAAKKAWDKLTGSMGDLLALQEAMKEARMNTKSVDDQIFAAYQRINGEIERGVSLTNEQLATAIRLRTQLAAAMAPIPGNVGITPNNAPRPGMTVKGSNVFDSKGRFGDTVRGMFRRPAAGRPEPSDGRTLAGAIGDQIKFTEIGQMAKSFAEFGPMAAILPVINSALESLAPVFTALMEPLRMVGKIVGDVLAPPLKLIADLLGVVLYPVLKLLSVVARVVTVAISYFAEALGNVIKFIGKLIDSLPFVSARGIIRMGQEMIDAAKAARRNTDATEDATDAVEKFAGALSNIPRVLNINALRHLVTGESGSGGGGGSGGGSGGRPGGGKDWGAGPGGPAQMSVGTINISIDGAGDPKRVAEEVGRVIERQRMKGGVSRLQAALA